MQIGFESFLHDKKERERDGDQRRKRKHEIQYFL